MNSKLTVLCSRNRSAVLAYIYIHTHTSICRRVSDVDRHTLMLTLDLTCGQTHTHISGRFSYTTSRSASITHTHTSSYLLENCLMMIYTYIHPCPRLIACTNTFLLHVYRSVNVKERRVTPCMHAALHATAVLISPVWDETC